MQKILIIDDDPGCRELLREALQHQGFHPLEAGSGREGIELARREVPDLIVCDVCMDEGDGYAVLHALREDASTDSIPFIFMTGMSDEEGMRHGMEQGADDYLTKPFSLATFLAAVQARLKKQAAVRQQADKRLAELRSHLSLVLPHELLTPLVGILGFGELIRGQAESIRPAELREMGQGIVDSVRRLQRLIQNFLLHARLQLIQSEPEELAALRGRQCPNARQLVSEAALKQASACHRAADLHLELTDLNPAIGGELLAKLVEELVANAFKFSGAGQSVVVRLAAKDRGLELAVIDKGRGMSAEQVREIGAYVQFERRFHEQQGTGLGLFLARRLAELHGGGLTVTSVPEAGTTVTVRLPSASAP